MAVDLKKLKSNFEKIRARVGSDVEVIPILKGNAYGLGGVGLANFYAGTLGSKMIGVAHVREAVELRDAGISCELLVLGGAPFNNIPAAAAYSIQTAAYEREYVDLLDREAEKQGKIAEIQIKINTGLNRIGVKPGEELINFVRYIKTKPHIKVRGAFTHFAASHTADHSLTLGQFELFKQGISEVRACGVEMDYIHACNGCAAVWFSEAYCTAVRPGNLLFGYDNNENTENALGVEPAVTWRCFVTQLRTLRPGESVGYNRYFTAKEPLRAATISVGFGDGYYRPMLMGKGYALINGKRCRFLATSMDQTWLEIDGVPNVALNNEVTLLGKDGDDELTVYDWRKFCGESIVFLSSIISNRVERVFLS
ncbi:MAG: alanine racemase [Synergistaceae bacterium]|nr:alanine racemase [Synergistaceae bacterium]